MSVKYFGEFLVQKGVIKIESLVQSLIEQMTSQPPICQVVFEKGLLTAEELMNVFRCQQDQQVDFIAACKELGIWHSQFEKEVQLALNDFRIPLGQILVKRGDLDLKRLTQMLDEFLSQAEVSVSIPEKKLEIVEEPPVETEQEAVTLPEAVTPSTDDMDYSPGLIMELEEVFDEKKRKGLKIALSFIKDKTPVDEQVTRKLFQDTLKIVHTINGLVQILGLKHLGKLISTSEEIITAHLGRSPEAPEHQALADTLTRAFEEGWKIRSSILEKFTEKYYFSDTANKSSYENIMAELESIKGHQ